MKKKWLVLISVVASTTFSQAQIEVRTEAQVSVTDGDHTPLWLNANRYGLSSLDKANGYVRAGAFRSLAQDSARRWQRGFGVDVAVAGGFTSTLVVQQLYGEIGWGKGLLTLGAKEQPMELRDNVLSSGAQTLGINARPVPGLRLSLPDYWEIPYTKGWLGLKGHIFYGYTTDDGWQKDFTHRDKKYTEHTMLHTKAGYLRIGKPEKPFSLELGLEMGCQFAGKAYYPPGYDYEYIENETGFSSLLHAFFTGGGEVVEGDYKNVEGNHLGSWLMRANLDYDRWGLSVYADHFFEDHSQMFFLDYDGYGTGDKWNSWERRRWMVYDLRDMMLGVELRLNRCRWVDVVVAEYIYTKYQSGPIYHDRTKTMPDHVAGIDEYYNHYIFTGWQHWGQVMGNPLYRSPLYNDNGDIYIQNSRFWAWHFGVKGTPVQGLSYRLLATWQRGWGTYKRPLLSPQRNMSLLAEAAYTFPGGSSLRGWSVKGGVALDHGQLLGNNMGMQLTVGRCLSVETKKKREQ